MRELLTHIINEKKNIVSDGVCDVFLKMSKIISGESSFKNSTSIYLKHFPIMLRTMIAHPLYASKELVEMADEQDLDVIKATIRRQFRL